MMPTNTLNMAVDLTNNINMAIDLTATAWRPPEMAQHVTVRKAVVTNPLIVTDIG